MCSVKKSFIWLKSFSFFFWFFSSFGSLGSSLSFYILKFKKIFSTTWPLKPFYTHFDGQFSPVTSNFSCLHNLFQVQLGVDLVVGNVFFVECFYSQQFLQRNFRIFFILEHIEFFWNFWQILFKFLFFWFPVIDRFCFKEKEFVL